VGGFVDYSLFILHYSFARAIATAASALLPTAITIVLMTTTPIRLTEAVKAAG
jgi:hypothetical protein